MPFSVIYDANVLYGNTLRDLHIRIAREKLTRLRELINNAVADCLVTGYEPLVDQLKLSDMDDRHLLAAAIKAGAQVIVTADRGFTPQELEPWSIEAKSQTTSFSTRSVSTQRLFTLVLVKLRTRAVAHLRLSRVCSSS